MNLKTFQILMDFPSLDLFDDVVDNSPRVDHAEVARQAYTAKICPLTAETHCFKSDRDSLKMTADLAYYMKDYKQALALYKQVYSDPGCTSQSVKRDVAECLARTSMALGESGAAGGYCEEIEQGWAGHADQRLVVGQLRLDIARLVGDWGDKTGAIMCEMVELHSSLGRYWMWLADWYKERGEEVNEFWSLVRAQEVGRLEGVKSSVKENQVTRRIQNSQVDQQLQQKIVDFVSRDARNRKSEKEEVAGEFEDLGSSVRMRKVEEALTEQSEENSDGRKDCNLIIRQFQQKWFPELN